MHSEPTAPVTAKASEQALVYGQIAVPGFDASNLVFHKVLTVSGKTQGVIYAPYDGTQEDALRVAGQLHAVRDEMFTADWDDWNSHSNSQTVTTDAEGKPKWIISPNRCLVTVIESSGADRILEGPSVMQS